MSVFVKGKKPDADKKRDEDAVNEYFTNMFTVVCLKNTAEIGVAAAAQTLRVFEEVSTVTAIKKKDLHRIFSTNFDPAFKISEEDLPGAKENKKGILAYKGYLITNSAKFKDYLSTENIKDMASEKEVTVSKEIYQNFKREKEEQERQALEKERLEAEKQREKESSVPVVDEATSMPEKSTADTEMRLYSLTDVDTRRPSDVAKREKANSSRFWGVVLIGFVVLLIVVALIITKPWKTTALADESLYCVGLVQSSTYGQLQAMINSKFSINCGSDIVGLYEEMV